MATPSSGVLYAVLLAAGESRRLGQPKQLIRINQRALVQMIASEAVTVCGSAVVVVVGAHAQDITPLLRSLPVSVVVNRAWQEGLSSSIRAGVDALPPSCEGVMLLLCDQAAITGNDLRRLVAMWRRNENAIVASSYSGTIGVPAIFPRWAFSELSALRGDHGAKRVIKRNSSQLVRVPLPNAEVDLDTDADLDEYLLRSMEE